MKVAKNFVVIVVGFWLGLKAEWQAWLPFWRIVWAIIAIQKWYFVFVGFFAIFVDSFRIGRISIGAPGGDKFFCPFDINVFALSLVIWAVCATALWAFVPIESNPLQSILNELGSALDVASLISILDAQNKSSIALFGNKIWINCRA